MFKVLVIAYYYPPMGMSGVQRTLKFTKYMKKYNWEPTVITAGDVGYFAHDNSLLSEVANADIRVVRTEGKEPNSVLKKFGTISLPREWIRKLLSNLSKTFFIPDNKISWSQSAYKTAKDLLKNEKYDVIFVSIPPFSAFSIAIQLKKEFEIPVIVDYRDLWLNNQFAFYPTPLHKHLHKKKEYEALRFSDKIIVVNRRIKEEILKNYGFLKFEDIVIIPHGFDQEDFLNCPPQKSSLKKDKIRILYSGIFYENITPKLFFQAFNELRKEFPYIANFFELHFIGHFRKENLKLVKKLKLESFVYVHGYMEHTEVIKKLSEADILWMMLGNGKNMDTVTAGKLFEYFGTRKPIMALLPDGASKNACVEYEASFISDPDNIIDIKNNFIKMYNLFINNKLPIPNEEFVLKHDREFLTKLLTQQFQFNLKEIQ
ncbi:MAG: glycosyl transferase family 1 [Ignavibacteriales bacterium CG_4_9_14_3_um_filter_34_10]|nr:MAG: glycosyl transferase family 1 [Ignavibacteriales bacterium CG_4_9_14_3_um_filter_34_10]